jgi:hypothetical protein
MKIHIDHAQLSSAYFNRVAPFGNRLSLDCKIQGGIRYMKSKQITLNHVLGSRLGQSRDRANNAEDRALAPGLGEVFQDPVSER